MTLAGQSAAIWGVAFSPNGRQLATASDGGTVRLWEVNSHAVISQLTVGASVWALAWGVGGIAIATQAGLLQLVIIESKRPARSAMSRFHNAAR